MKRVFSASGARPPTKVAAPDDERLLRDLRKLEETFRLWLRTGSPIDATRIQVVLENSLGFTHRAPRGGSSHITLVHPSGQIVGLVVGTPTLGPQISAAKAGLSVLNEIRTKILEKRHQSAPVPERPTRPQLSDKIPEILEALPLDEGGKDLILRSRAFPQIGALAHEGMSEGNLARVLGDLKSTQRCLESFLERADDLEFDVLHEGGILTLAHRVYGGLSCVLKPWDPLENRDPQRLVRALDAFDARIMELDQEAEKKRAKLLDTRLYEEEHTSCEAPESGYQVVKGSFSNPLTDAVYKTVYSKSPQGRIDPLSFLKMLDTVYGSVFGSLKKDGARLYGLEATMPEKGLIRLRHPYVSSIKEEMLDLRESFLGVAYRKAAESGFSKPLDESFLFDDKIVNLSKLRDVGNELVGYIDSLGREYAGLLTFAQRSPNMRISASQETTPGKEGAQTFSYRGANNQSVRCVLPFISRTLTNSETISCRQSGLNRGAYVGLLPNPEKLLELYNFLTEGIENLLPQEPGLPPYPAQAACLNARNKGQQNTQPNITLPRLVL